MQHFGKYRKLAIILILTLISTANAATFGNFTYEVIDGKAVTITDYRQSSNNNNTEVIIPDTIESLPVTVIEQSAFGFCSSLASITIPAGVTTIEKSAFSSCSSLASIRVSSDNPVYSDINGVLFNKLKTTLVVYPSGLSGSYTISDNVSSIEEGAFYSANFLTSLVIPASVTSIGMSILSCESLMSIDVSSGNPKYSDINGVLFDKGQTTILTYPGGRNGVYTIPDSVTSIGDGAFYGCMAMSSITIPSTVTVIGEWSFGYCSGLTSIKIPNRVTSIGDFAFGSCRSLSSLILPNGLTAVGKLTFYECDALTSITIPSSVSLIREKTFLYCRALKSVFFKNNAPTVDATAFEYCSPTIYYCAGKTGFDDNSDGFADFDSRLPVEVFNFIPTINFAFVQIGDELTWGVDYEFDIKEYQVIDAESGEVITVITAGEGDYSVKLPEGVEAKVVVVADSGYEQTYFPDDSFGDVNTTVYDLVEGWNLISIAGDNPDLTELKVVTTGVLWAWDGEDYQVVSETYPTQGLWVYSYAAKQVTVTSDKVDTPITLNLGWNMVGPVKNCEISEEALTTYCWNDIYKTVAADSTLFEGVGYWMFSLE